MKFYVKPTVDVVELSVKESIADIPACLSYAKGGVTGSNYVDAGVPFAQTAYDIATTSTSDTQDGDVA